MIPEAWVKQPFALVHGDDADRRREAVGAWKREHVDPEWADFSLSVCGEGCSWAEVLNALQEATPLGAAARVVIVPAADNLLSKPKELPATVRAFIDQRPSDLRLLMVAWTTLPAGPGKALGAKPWSDWVKEGRALKVGALEPTEVPGFLEAEAKALGLKLDARVPVLLGARLGGNPGLLKRAMEVLDLLAEDRRVTDVMVDAVTFRIADQKAFAWSGAWQKGDVSGALMALRQAIEDDDDVFVKLGLLGQARREVERVLRLLEAEQRGVKSGELLGALGLSPKQSFLLDGYRGVAQRLKSPGVKALLGRLNQAEKDLKGHTLSRSESSLLDLTLVLCRTWRPWS